MAEYSLIQKMTGSALMHTTLLLLVLCTRYRTVTSQADQPVVLPDNTTYKADNSTVSPTGSVLPRNQTTRLVTLNDTTGSNTSTTPPIRPPSGDCRLVTVHRVRGVIEELLASGAKLVEMNVTLAGYPPDFLQYRLRDVFSPQHWVRSTGRQGRSLLVLEDNYDFMSLFFLSIGVHTTNVTITDSPRNCLRWKDPEEVMFLVRQLMLNDFLPESQGEGSLSASQEVCNMKLKDDDGYAEFVYTCCHKSYQGEIFCSDVKRDSWIDVLMAFVVIAKILVVLYSPSFLPGTLYRLKYVAAEYLYRTSDPGASAGGGWKAGGGDSGPEAEAGDQPEVDGPMSVKHFNMVITQYPNTYGNDEKVVRLSHVKGMEYFKAMVANMRTERLYRVTYDVAKLSVKSRRLLSENYVPVSLLRMLYNNLLRCRIRRLAPLKDCCDTNLLGKLNPGLPIIKWFKCMRALANVVLLLLLISPWLIRSWVFFNFEEHLVEEKRAAAEQRGLSLYFKGSLTLFLSPLHGFFVIIYILFIVDSLVYGVVSKAMKEKLKMVLRKCLRDMRERSRIEVCGWAAWLFLLPFKEFGVVGLLLILPFLLIVLPFALPLAAFYMFPALNLTVRLIIHLFIFMCPPKVLEKWDRFSARFHEVRAKFSLNKVTAQETFEDPNKLNKKNVILQVVVILMCLVSFWSLTFLLMEVVSFLVEMVLYTLMGIIVNAGATLQYITVAFLTLMYGRSTFNEVYGVYLAYHQEIHRSLLAMKRQEIDSIAIKAELEQENNCLRVTGEMAPKAKDSDIRLIVKDGVPMFRTSSMLMFLDRRDTPYTPEKFFYDAILLDYCGAPGPLYRQYMRAFWSFGRILLFLFFVFVVVMAFGDAYSVSTTNQLLATVAGGFIPFLFRYVFPATAAPSLHTESVQFRTQFHKAINSYMQNWPVFDLEPREFGEMNPRDSLLFNSTGKPSDQPVSPLILEESRVGDVNLNIENEEEEESEGGLDLIIDVSTEESRYRGPEGMREAGSVSMLAADSFNRSASARIYKPPRERPIDV